jgi:hypothetical protein
MKIYILEHFNSTWTSKRIMCSRHAKSGERVSSKLKRLPTWGTAPFWRKHVVIVVIFYKNAHFIPWLVYMNTLHEKMAQIIEKRGTPHTFRGFTNGRWFPCPTTWNRVGPAGQCVADHTSPDGNGYPLPTYPAGFYPLGWGYGRKPKPIGMQMAKYLYPMGIVGAGIIIHNLHPHIHLPDYPRIWHVGPS